MIISTHCKSQADDPIFRFGEYVKSGARRGTYIAKMGAQVLVEWNDTKLTKACPMGILESTGVLNEQFIERCVAAPHKAKGGVKTGSRRKIHNPAEKTLRRQFVRAKLLKKGYEPKSASDEPLQKPGTKKEEGTTTNA